MKNVMKELSSITRVPENAWEVLEEHEEEWSEEFQRLLEASHVKCSERNKKLIFLACKLGIAESKMDHARCFENVKNNPMTLVEVSLVEAAFRFVFMNQEIYLVIRNTFWKIDDIKELLIHHQYEGTFACEKENHFSEHTNGCIRGMALECCSRIPGYQNLTIKKKNALYDMVKEAIELSL